MYSFGELPSDLEDMEESMGPPPAWFRPEQGITNPAQMYYSQYFYNGLSGLGDRVAEEIEVNPVEGLQDLKYNQQRNKKIPLVANRYTEINPISPLFRDKKAKFGYGDWKKPSNLCIVLTLVTVIGVIALLKSKGAF